MSDSDDWDDDDLDDTEYSDDASAWDEEPAIVPCPHCGAEVSEEAEQCPLCGDYITPDRSALSGWPWWFVAFGVCGAVGLIIVMLIP